MLEALSHFKNPHFDLVFCGGTCLSKAYKLIRRMSEDIDFKVIVKHGVEFPSKNQLRKALKELVSNIQIILKEKGFVEELIQKTSKDENKYNRFEISYTSVFDQKSEALRPHLLLEFNFTEIQTSTIEAKLTTLMEDVRNATSNVYGAVKAGDGPIISCISLEEAVSEKLVSFSRRLIKQLDKHHELPIKEALSADNGWDPALVRHLYDVYEILGKTQVNLIYADILIGVIKKDQQDFKNQDQRFVENPIGQLQKALELSQYGQVSELLEKQYKQFVSDMVYAETVPTYHEALACFSNALLSNLPISPPNKSRSIP